MAKMAKIRFVEKSRLKSLQLSTFTPSTAQQSAAHSDDRLKSYGQKTPIFGHFGQMSTGLEIYLLLEVSATSGRSNF